MKSVAIIGAGSAGLGVARILSQRLETFKPVVFERSRGVGGTWIYSENTGLDEFGLEMHSSLYANLVTNLPTDLMAFAEFPFKHKQTEFIKHQDVLEYLRDYTQHFDLFPYIKFNHIVEEISPVDDEPSREMKWNVRVKDLIKGEVIEDIYDFVFVCNGHYSVPRIPEIPGVESFLGKVFHCHEYKHPEDYKDLTVACLGAGNSGIDIAVELCEFSAQVLLCHNHALLQSDLPPNMSQTLAIAEMTEDSIITTDGKKHKIDVLIYCTGYYYSFPFLHEDCGISVINNRVSPLFKHIVNTTYPTMFFLGLCIRVTTFPGFFCQAKFVETLLDGSQKLPSKQDMDEDTQKDLERRRKLGKPPHKAHELDFEQWDYYDLLCEMAAIPLLVPRRLEQLYNACLYNRKKFILTYKSMKYEVGYDGGYRVTEENTD